MTIDISILRISEMYRALCPIFKVKAEFKFELPCGERLVVGFTRRYFIVENVRLPRLEWFSENAIVLGKATLLAIHEYRCLMDADYILPITVLNKPIRAALFEFLGAVSARIRHDHGMRSQSRC